MKLIALFLELVVVVYYELTFEALSRCKFTRDITNMGI